MAIVWTIKGEAGKAVDASTHTLPELQAEGAVVEFRSLDSDRLTWSVWLGRYGEVAGLVPDNGQKITLYRNGARFFTGNVVNPKIVAEGGRVTAQITVEGPWWWLKNMMISNVLADQAGTTKERAAYVFATGGVKNHLQGLAARAIDAGAPISAGSIADTFNIPRLSLRDMSYAEAFCELMRWVADGTLYFDYSGSDATPPALCMQRRGAAATVTITPSLGCFPRIEITPRLDLKLSQVKVASAERATVDNRRVTQWALQTAGTADTTRPSVQLVTTSGPEVDTYLPQDFTDAVVVRSAEIGAAQIILNKEDRLRLTGGIGLSLGPYDDGLFATQDFPTTITDADGNSLPAGYNYYLTAGETKDWWAKDGIGWINARVTAMIHTAIDAELPLPSPYTVTPPSWYQAIGGSMQGGYIVPDPARMRWVFYTTVSVPFIAVKNDWSTDTTLIRQEDYAFVNPPADLAANLLASQNWLPHEGAISQAIDPGDIPAGHHLGKRVDVMELLPVHESMGALIVGQAITLRSGQVSYTLGAPARHAYRDLVNRFRQSGADNIVYLNETNPVSPPSGPGTPSSHWTLTEGGEVEVGEDGSTAVDEDDT